MSIEKMKYVYFVGEKEYLYSFISKYLLDNYELQPEYAVGSLENVKGLYSYRGTNPCTELISQCEKLIEDLGINKTEIEDTRDLSLEEIEDFLKNTKEGFNSLKEEKRKIDEDIANRISQKEQLKDIGELDFDLSKLFNLRFFKIRYGRIPTLHYRRLAQYIKELDVIIFHTSSTKLYNHLIYIVPDVNASRVDGIFNSLHFERIRIPIDFQGTPKESIALIEEEISRKTLKLQEVESAINAFSSRTAEKLLLCLKCLYEKNRVYEISKYAGFNKKSFYLVGWMPARELSRIQEVIEKDPRVLTVEDPADAMKRDAPTKLKNNILVRPFESLVKMYGLPAYDEIDPTPIIALVYSLMVGMMFGDVGQGLIFVIAGLILSKKGAALGGVFLSGGISASIFGLLYGSIFSLEHVIPPLLINPIESANINTMLALGIALGCVLLIMGMALNIANGIKAHDIGRVLFDRNGVSGLMFYGTIIFTILIYLVKGRLFLPIQYILLILLIPFVLIFFKHPIENALHHKSFMPKDKAGFLIETLFEMVDMLLSFASNTISFVRISAFAINHVGLSMAVVILSEMASGLAGKVIIMIIGNALIICLEGLIVGIQGLRLVYYELFSRFFKGNGREYVPISKSVNR